VASGVKRININELRTGHVQQCRELVCSHYEAIYRFMAYLTRDINMAEELTQETFACAWENIGSFRGRASLGTWLHKIAYRKFIDSKRKIKRDSALTEALKNQNNGASQDRDPFHKIAKDENQQLLYDALKQLDTPDCTIIVLHYIQGLTYRQIARIFQEPRGTVKWRTNSAIKKLRAILTKRIEP
jgi:RNA polymerase sigma-70 factor (ECF subfamily)